MPINYADYSPEWPSIRARILARAGDRCERCRRPNGLSAFVYQDGSWGHGDGYFYDENGNMLDDDVPDGEPRLVKTVLTISHTDHDRDNNDDGNLTSLCQRCHLRHDALHHAVNAAATRARKRNQKQEAAGVLALPI